MLGSLSSLALLAPLLLAGSLTQPVDPQHIYGGDEVDSCGWPSVVYLSGGGGACTGTLIHPRVVLTAAHCVTDGIPSAVRFGENAQTAQQLVTTTTCRQGPGWNGATAQGEDYAYCLLDAPVTSVPIIPVVNACEASAVYQGARIMHVGFGRDQDGASGRKKMLELTISNITGAGELISGTPTEVICNGDSGGPTFVYLDPAQGGDGSWRVAAIHSWAQGADPVEPNCNTAAGSVLVTNAIDWIEADSGIDITPCADGDTWSPTAQCGGIPTTPWEGAGTYTTACTTPEEIEWAQTCGAGLDATPDDAAPTISIVSPTMEQEFDGGGGTQVEVTAEASDEGWGVATVSMTIRDTASGMEQVDTRNEWEPWVWGLTLPDGAYEVSMVATDYAGNESRPQTVCFGVGGPGCDGSDDSGGGADSGAEGSSGGLSGGTGGGSGDDETGETAGATSPTSGPSGTSGDDAGTGGADSAAADDSDDGGGCQVGSTPSAWGLLLLGLVAIRRRRG